MIASLVWVSAVCFATGSLAVTFTTSVTIAEGETTYDGQDIIVDGATATINGPHSFNSLVGRLRRTDTIRTGYNASGGACVRCRFGTTNV